MLRALTILVALCATPAFATEWVSCANKDGAASFDYLAGDGVDVLAISAITVTAGEKVWASDPANGPGDPIKVGQAFEGTDTVLIDGVDDGYSVIASLKLFKATEGDKMAMAGTLTIKGMGAWAVDCDPDAQ
jgi:hypothetical protein